MRVGRLLFTALLLILPAESFAQNANPLTANAKMQLGALTGFVLRSAEKVPEDLYSFRATPDVRSAWASFRPHRRRAVRDVLDRRRVEAAARRHRESGHRESRARSPR